MQKMFIWIQKLHCSCKNGIERYKDNIHEDIAKNVETRFDTSNFEIDRPLSKGTLKK